MFKCFSTRSTWTLWHSVNSGRISLVALSRVAKPGPWLRQYFSKQASTCLLLSRRSYTAQNPKTGRLPFEINTNVARDALVYSNDNFRFFKILSYFGALQFLFWGNLAHFAYFNLKDTSREDQEKTLETNLRQDVAWWRRINLGQDKYRKGIALVCLSLGYTLFLLSMIYPVRAVRHLVLLKGGQSVGITTFFPFGSTRSFDVPLANISCLQSRTQAKSYIPLKIKGRWFYFLLDKQGVFHNQDLFDYCIGLNRNLKK